MGILTEEEQHQLLKQIALCYGAWAKYGYEHHITQFNLNHLYEMAKELNEDEMTEAFRDYDGILAKPT